MECSIFLSSIDQSSGGDEYWKSISAYSNASAHWDNLFTFGDIGLSFPTTSGPFVDVVVSHASAEHVESIASESNLRSLANCFPLDVEGLLWVRWSIDISTSASGYELPLVLFTRLASSELLSDLSSSKDLASSFVTPHVDL